MSRSEEEVQPLHSEAYEASLLKMWKPRCSISSASTGLPSCDVMRSFSSDSGQCVVVPASSAKDAALRIFLDQTAQSESDEALSFDPLGSHASLHGQAQAAAESEAFLGDPSGGFWLVGGRAELDRLSDNPQESDDKRGLIEQARVASAFRLAQISQAAQRRVEAGEVLRLDAHGSVSGFLPALGPRDRRATRQKYAYRRFHPRKPDPSSTDAIAFCTDESGKVILYLRLVGEIQARPYRTFSDGPALTLSGKVVDFQSGGKIEFSHVEATSPSKDEAERVREISRMARAAAVAHAICDAEHLVQGYSVCSIDRAGIIRGFPNAIGGPGSWAQPIPRSVGERRASRLKRFHRIRRRRTDSAFIGSACSLNTILCINSHGQVCIHLHIEPDFDEHFITYRQHSPSRRFAMPSVGEEGGNGIIYVVDSNGTIWDHVG